MIHRLEVNEMANEPMSIPPKNMNGIGRPGRGMEVVKPKDLKGSLLRLWKLTKGHRQGLGIVLVLSALSSLAAILSPYITGNAISAVKAQEPIKLVLLMLVGLYITEALIKFLQQFLMATIGQRIIHHIRTALFEAIKKLPLSFFDKHQHGELMSRLTNDIDNISTTISSSLTMLLTHFFTIAGVLIMMLTLSPLLTIVAFVGVGLILLLTKIVTKHTKKLFKERSADLGVLNGHIEEGISGLFVVKAFCREKDMESTFSVKNDKLTRTSIKALIWSGYLMPLMNVINNLCYVAIAVFSGVLFVQGKISGIGIITSFLLYVRQFTRPFVEIANIYNSFQTAVAGAERVFEIMDEQPEPEDKPDALPLKNPGGDIVFDHVSFGYDSSKLVLKDISLKIPAGTQVAIVGPTRSGKTTIINLLTRFYDVTGGSITLDGHDLRDYRMADLRDAFGVVLQDTALFQASIRDNIAYGNLDEADLARRKRTAADFSDVEIIAKTDASVVLDDSDNAGIATLNGNSAGSGDSDSTDPYIEDIKQAARIAGADSFIERLPKGYDTVLTQGGAELSQGERQLLTIARAVLTGAPIMILDEATSSVDTVTEQKIRRAMLKICENRTSFIIAHRLSTIRDSDLIILIEDGVIAEQGTHEELLALNGKYAEMYRTQTAQI